MFHIFFLFLATIAFSQTTQLSGAKIEKGNVPLIMERADELNATKRAGTFLLKGNVKFKHDSIEFRTQRAHWNKNTDAVYSEGGFDFRYPRGSIIAEKGTYSRKDNIATAEGNAIARDSAGKGAFFGEKIIYTRENQFVEIPLKPVAHYYFEEKGKLDTLAIHSKKMTYDQKAEIAVASDSVLITRRDVVITGNYGFFNQKEGFMILTGNPICRMSDYTVEGDSMYVKLQDNEVESVLVINNAHGTQETAAIGRKPSQHSEVFGDTLFLAVKNNKAQRLYVNVAARGLFFEADLPEYVNKMNGDRLDISFDLGRMEIAEVTGNASSLLFYVNTDRKIDGKNESSGEAILISFDSSQVSKIKVKGETSKLASGIYYDMSKGVKSESEDP